MFKVSRKPYRLYIIQYSYFIVGESIPNIFEKCLTVLGRIRARFLLVFIDRLSWEILTNSFRAHTVYVYIHNICMYMDMYKP